MLKGKLTVYGIDSMTTTYNCNIEEQDLMVSNLNKVIVEIDLVNRPTVAHEEPSYEEPVSPLQEFSLSDIDLYCKINRMAGHNEVSPTTELRNHFIARGAHPHVVEHLVERFNHLREIMGEMETDVSPVPQPMQDEWAILVNSMAGGIPTIVVGALEGLMDGKYKLEKTDE